MLTYIVRRPPYHPCQGVDETDCCRSLKHGDKYIGFSLLSTVLLSVLVFARNFSLNNF